MDFLEWLVIEECSKKYIKKHDLIDDLINTIKEAAEMTGFLEEKLNKSKKSPIKQESWKSKLSKITWENLLENEEEDEEPVEIKSPFSDDDSAQPIDPDKYAALHGPTEDEEEHDDDEEDKAARKESERLKSLKEIKDSMLVIRWNAMNERDKLIKNLDPSLPNKENEKILKKLGYNDINDLPRALKEDDNEVSDEIKAILNNERVRNAEEVISNLLYKIKLNRDGEEKGSGILAGAIFKAHLKSKQINQTHSKSDIFSTFIMKLFSFLSDKKIPSGSRVPTWSGLPEEIKDFKDFDKNDNKTLRGISYYLTAMVHSAPKLDDREAGKQLNPKGKRKKADTKSTGMFTSLVNKKTLVNHDLKNNKFEFYIKVIDALRNVTEWDAEAEQKLNAIDPNFYENDLSTLGQQKPGKVRKAIIKDMFMVKLLPDDSIKSGVTDTAVRKLLNKYMEMVQSQFVATRYQKVTHASALSNDEDGKSGEDIDIATGLGSGSRSRVSDDDPAKLAADAEEERLLGPKKSFFDALKEAMDSLLSTRRELGLAYCLSRNLQCSGGLPDSPELLTSWKKVTSMDVAAKLNDIMKPITPYSDAQVRQFVDKAKEYLELYFKKNYPSLIGNLMLLFDR